MGRICRWTAGRSLASVGLVAGVLVLAAGGCEGVGPRLVSPGQTAGRSGDEGGARRNGAEIAADTVAVSSLRERALVLLEGMARDESPEIRANAVEALSAAPGRLDAALPAALADENQAVRTVGAMSVGREKLDRSLPLVEPLLNDPSPYVRAAAIYAMRSNDPSFNPSALAPILLGDPSPRVRSHVAFILGELGDPSAKGLLRQAGKQRLPRAAAAETRLFQLQIAEALVKLGDDSQLEAVRAALYPSSPDELEGVALAIQILGEVGDRGAIDQLIYRSGAKDDSGQMLPPEIRLAIAASLARLGLTEGSFIAEEYVDSERPTVRAQAAHVLGQTGRSQHLGRLEQMMDDPEAMVRLAAAAAILRMTEAGTAEAGSTES